jgi:hypothetical protein
VRAFFVIIRSKLHATIPAFDSTGAMHATSRVCRHPGTGPAVRLRQRSQLQTKVTLAQLKDIPGVLPLTAGCAARGIAGPTVAASQFQNQFRQVFGIFKGLGSAKPSGHFTIDLKGKKAGNAESAALSFN